MALASIHSSTCWLYVQWGNGPLLGSQEELVMVYMLSLPMGTRNTAIKPNRRGFVGMIAGYEVKRRTWSTGGMEEGGQ